MFRETLKFSAFMTALFCCVKVAGVFGVIVLIIAVCFYAQWLNGRSLSSTLNIDDVEERDTMTRLREVQSWSSGLCYEEHEQPCEPRLSEIERTY